MFAPSKNILPWQKKDYVLSILQFVLHWIILSAIVIFANFLSAGSFNALKEYHTSSSTNQDFLYILCSFAFILAAIYLYFFFEFRNYLLKAKNIAVLFVIMEFCIIISYITGKYVNVYARPVAMCALLVLMLINKRTAIFINFCYCLMMFLLDVYGVQTFASSNAIYSSLLSVFSGGLLGIYLLDNVGSRVVVLARGLFIAIPIMVCTFCLEYHQGITFIKMLTFLLYAFMSGATSVLYMMAVLPVFEYFFNVLTNFRLVEITDHKSKLIQKLMNEAVGSFNHSLVVASLAEACASSIGENPLLARAAGYYHDIGKIKQPEFFSENQHGKNPHDELTPELSTEIIRSHAKDGFELIRKYHLPLILADVAREHHGTLPIQFFYIKAQKYTEGELDIADYSYQGPKPHTKIAAIIMLADGCEAAVRAQNDRSSEKVEKVVRSIIEDRMNHDQFSDCEITMKDLSIIRKTLENGLTGVYHERIDYPQLKVSYKSSFGGEEPQNTIKKTK